MSQQKLIQAIVGMREEEALRLADEALGKGTAPEEILEAGRQAMQKIGQRFESGDCFVPELILAGEILKQISEKVKPHLKAKTTAAARRGVVVLGTVEGDIHDIAKNIVGFMLDINGFEVVDLGVDVPASGFVKAAQERGAAVVALSGFLTLAYDPMKATVDALEKAGLRGKVRVMIGGGQIDEQVRAYTGADAFGRDAMAAVALAGQWIGK